MIPQAKHTFLTLLLCTGFLFTQAQIGINTDMPNASSVLDVVSSEKGLLTPRMTTAQREAIMDPADGLMAYDSTTASFWYYDNNQWNEIRNGSNQLSALDLAESLPESDFSCLEIISQLNISGSIKAISLVDNYLYVLGGNVLNAINISDPNNPIIEGTISIVNLLEIVAAPGYVFGIASGFTGSSSGDIGLFVIDVADPTNMIIVDQFFLSTNLKSALAYNDGFLYVSTTEGFNRYDLSDPTNLDDNVVGTASVNESSDISVLGDYAYAVGNISGATIGSLEILDITGTFFIPVVGSLSLGNSPMGVAVSGNYAYVIDDDSNDLRVIDVSTPSTPNQITSLNLGGSPEAIEVSGNYAYVVSTGSNDLKVIDISNPANPVLITSVPAGQAGHIEILGNYAYVANANLNVFELACPFSLDIDPSSGEFIATSVLHVEGFTLNETTSELTLNSNQFTPTADLSAIRKFGNIDTGIESTGQGTSNQAGNGFTTTPWVYTNAVEAQGERGTASTLITIGDDGTYGNDDEIHLVTDGSSRLRVNANGNVGIKRNANTNSLEVNGNASKNSAGDWLANSDARLKKNIQQLNPETILEKLLSLKGVTYEWDDDKTDYERPEGIQYGFTAQNIQKVFPTLVDEDAEGYLQTAYGTYDAMYVEAIRALQQQIDVLKTDNSKLKIENEELKAFKAKNENLESRLAKIEAMLFADDFTSNK